MGYDSRTAGAIRATSDYYDRCSERDELEGTFWYDGGLLLPSSFAFSAFLIIRCYGTFRMWPASLVSVMDANYQSSHLALECPIPFPPCTTR